MMMTRTLAPANPRFFEVAEVLAFGIEVPAGRVHWNVIGDLTDDSAGDLIEAVISLPAGHIASDYADEIARALHTNHFIAAPVFSG